MTTENLLEASLKTAEPIIQEYIRDLIEENDQLKMKQAKAIKEKTTLKIKISELKIENQTYKQKISALQRALDKAESEKGEILFFKLILIKLHLLKVKSDITSQSRRRVIGCAFLQSQYPRALSPSLAIIEPISGVETNDSDTDC